MRVTLVNLFFPPDLAPTAHLAASLAEHRAASGDEVTVITGRGGYTGGRDRGGGSAGGEGDDGDGGAGGEGEPRHRAVRVVRSWTPSLGKASVARRLSDYAAFLAGALVRLVAMPRQDVVVAMTTPPYVVVAAMAHKLRHRQRPRVVLWTMDVYPDAVERFGPVRPGGLLARCLRVLNRRILRGVDEIVVLDEAMAALVAADLGDGTGRVPSPRLTVVPNWERLADYPAVDGIPPWPGYADAALRDRFVVLYMGNLGLGHTPDDVIEAAAGLDGEDVAFLFVGGGARWESLATAAADRGLDHVVLRPYVAKAETPGVLSGAACSLIVLDDRALGVMSPSKLHASLAMGRPIVYVGPAGSNVDAAIERFGCGVSLRIGDVEGLVAAIRRLRDDEAHRAELSRRARAAFESAYADRVVLPQLDAVLDGRPV